MSLYNNQEAIAVGDSPRTNMPSLWVNEYFKEQIADFIKVATPFFPSMPANIEDLQDMSISINNKKYPYSGVMAIYDRLIKRRRGVFPHIKSEQLVYMFYATEENAMENILSVSEIALRAFDREDESAQEINLWAKGKTIPVNGSNLTNRFYFHNFRVYQLEEIADNVSYQTTRTYALTKLIIEYDYHMV